MTPATWAPADTAPPPGRGQRVVLDELPGGPWMTVVEREQDGLLHLSPPRLGGRPVPLPIGRDFIVAYTVREVPCEVDARLEGGPAPGGEGCYLARIAGAPRRIQRRGAVRVPVNLIVHARVGEADDAPVLGAITENLSAGGALMRLPEPVDAGSTIRVNIHCGGEAGDLSLDASVLRCDRMDEGERPWRVAVTFAQLTVSEENRLVRFVFERQRELRCREAGLA